MFFQNVGIHMQHYTVSQPRRPQSEQFMPWKPENLNVNLLSCWLLQMEVSSSLLVSICIPLFEFGGIYWLTCVLLGFQYFQVTYIHTYIHTYMHIYISLPFVSSSADKHTHTYTYTHCSLYIFPLDAWCGCKMVYKCHLLIHAYEVLKFIMKFIK
jgi:hypothetical protein